MQGDNDDTMSPLNELAAIRARLEEKAAARLSDYHGSQARIDIEKPPPEPKSPRSQFPKFTEKPMEEYTPSSYTAEVRTLCSRPPSNLKSPTLASGPPRTPPLLILTISISSK